MSPLARLLRSAPLRTCLPALLALLFLVAGCSKEEPSFNNIPVSIYIQRVVKSTQPRTVDQAVDALGQMGAPAVPYLLKAWKKNDSAEIRCRIATALERIGPGAADAVPLLTDALSAIDEQVISCAAFALGGIGPAAAPAAQKLGSLLRSSDTTTQINLLYALGTIGAAAKDQVPLMLEAAEREKTRDAAIDALGRMGAPAVTAVQPWLDSGSQDQKLAALQVLANADTDDENQIKSVLPKLAALSDDKNQKVRLASIRAIAKAGPAAIEVQDKLIQALNDRDDDIHQAAIQALSNIGPEAGADNLIAALTNRHPRIREGAAKVIGRYSTLVEQAKSQLIRRFTDSSVYVRTAAIDAVTTAGPEVIPSMIRLLKSDSVLMRFGAARVLGNLGDASKNALPELKKMLNDKDALLRTEAQRAISKIRG